MDVTEGTQETGSTGTTVPGEDRPVSQINILPLLLQRVPDWIERKAKEVCRLTKEGEDGRQEFMEHRANQIRLYAGAIRRLGPPADGAKAPHLAILAKAILHLWARTYDQVIPAKGDIIKAVPVGAKDQESAVRREKHLNWQLRHDMPDWASGHSANILGWYMGGSQFRHYRYDPVKGKHRVDTIGIEDIVIPYTEKDDHPLMLEVPWLTRILKLARWEAERYEADGRWSNLDKVYPEAVDTEQDGSDVPAPKPDDASEVREAVDEVEGIQRPEKGSKHGKRVYHEHQAMWFFPEEADPGGEIGFGGKWKPVIATVDKITKHPVAVTIREEPDPIDQTRFNQEMKAYQIKVQNIANQVAMAPMPAMAPPPEAPKPPRPPRMQTIYNIVHYKLFPNPEGFYALGVGYLLEGANELANELAAEYLIAAKLENLQGGFMAQGTREKRGDLVARPGVWNETQLDPEVLSKGLMPFPHHPPSEGLMKVADKLEQNSEIAANADILSGEKGTSNETAKGMAIRNSNAMTLISVMTRLYLESMKYEIQMIAHGNAVQMDGPQTFPYRTQAGPDKQEVEDVTVTPDDYVEETHIEFTADARMSSKPERIADAMAAFDRILQSPLAQNLPLVDFAARKIWRAMEAPDYEAAMGQPPQPAPPPQPMSQEDENAGFINEQDHPVLPDDNHMEHLQKLDEFQQTPFFKEMSSTGRQLHERHRRGHLSHFYQQMNAVREETGIDVHGAVRGMGGAAGGPGGGGVQGPPGGAPGGGPEGPPTNGTFGKPGAGPGGGSPM